MPTAQYVPRTFMELTGSGLEGKCESAEVNY